MVFDSEDAVIPVKLRTKDFLLRPLRATDVNLDYAAVMESKEFLRLWNGDPNGWPTDDFTPEDNLEDLERHEQEHLNREAFTFTVMNLTETECLGAVYIMPFRSPLFEERFVSAIGPATVQDYEAVVAFWVRQARLAESLDERLLDTLITWFRDKWAFQGLLFMANEQLARQISLLDKSELRHRLTVEIPNKVGKYVLHGC